MWQAIIAASLAVFILRVLPAFFPKLKKLNQHPKILKFLDYTICLVTGELIYNIAFGTVEPGDKYISQLVITVIALTLASVVMIRTAKLSLSLLTALGFFIASYLVI
ncbi:MAG: AzlD domain-containing protein [Rickettsiales bacterium]